MRDFFFEILKHWALFGICAIEYNEHEYLGILIF